MKKLIEAVNQIGSFTVISFGYFFVYGIYQSVRISMGYIPKLENIGSMVYIVFAIVILTCFNLVVLRNKIKQMNEKIAEINKKISGFEDQSEFESMVEIYKGAGLARK